MDNRKDLSEDLQATPEHPAAPGAAGGRPLDPQAGEPSRDNSGEDGPNSSSQPATQNVSSKLRSLQQAVTRNPLPWIMSAVGLALFLRALRRARHH
jgi:hypothetical protein